MRAENGTDLSTEFAGTVSTQQRIEFFTNNFGAELDPAVADFYKDNHVFLVAGLGARQLKAAEEATNRGEEFRYFGSWVSELKKMGATSEVIYPYSRGLKGSAKHVIEKVEEFYKNPANKGKECFLVGHSRGGMVVMKAAMLAPELIINGEHPEKNTDKSVIRNVMTIQSPVNGHAYTSNVFVKFISRMGLGEYLPGGNFGLKPLEDEKIHEELSLDTLRKTVKPEDQKKVKDSVLYYTGYTDKIPGLELLAGVSDGLVTLIHQFRNDFGRVIGCFKANHLNAVVKMDDKSNNRRRQPAEAVAMVGLESLAQHNLRDIQYANAVEAREKNNIRAVLNKGPVKTLLSRHAHLFPHRHR